MPLNNPAAGAEVKYGTYTGDNGIDRAIPHGLATTPKIVHIGIGNGATVYQQLLGRAGITYWQPAAQALKVVSALDSTNFYVGTSGFLGESANVGTVDYWWVAIG